jgi:hypothetical protein
MSQDDVIVHYTGLRMRITGAGNLQMTMYSQDSIFIQPLSPFVMAVTTNIRPTRLMNFQHQRAALEGKTTSIYETFSINKIIIFAKAVFQEYPA